VTGSDALELDPYEALGRPLPEGPLDDQVRHALNAALVSPSPHNTQPWRWRVDHGVVELHADLSRKLTVSDPDARELTIGCGSALEHLLIGLSHHGLAASVAVLPEPGERTFLARATVTAPPAGTVGSDEPDAADGDLYAALATRRTNRHAYDATPLPPGLAPVLDDEAGAHDVGLRWVDDPAERQGLVELIMASDRQQMADTAFRQELASWMRRPGTHRGDGMPTDALGQHGIAAQVAPLAVRTFDVGEGQAARDAALTSGSPGLVVVATDDDDPAAWLATGRALARVVLRARSLGVWSAYMNQPCEVSDGRRELRHLLGLDGHPQLVVRLGSGPDARRSPRRPVADVLAP
jgi:hypothetical protein